MFPADSLTISMLQRMLSVSEIPKAVEDVYLKVKRKKDKINSKPFTEGELAIICYMSEIENLAAIAATTDGAPKGLDVNWSKIKPGASVQWRTSEGNERVGIFDGFNDGLASVKYLTDKGNRKKTVIRNLDKMKLIDG